MSRYLRRVLARTTGQVPGALQVARPHRWSSQAADPFAAAGADVPGGADRAATRIETGAPSSGGGERSAPFAAASWIASGAVDDGAGALDVRSRPRRILDRTARPDDGGIAPPERRGVRREGQLSAGEPSGSQRTPAAASGSPAGTHPSSATTPGHTAPPLALPAISRPGSTAAERRTEPSRVAMPLPMAPRRDPASAAAAPVEARGQAIAVGGLRISAPAAAPLQQIQHAAPSGSPAASRPEIVIGRISVVVDGARPPAAAPRTIVRRVTAAASAADDAGGSHRFGRFGLGQL